MNFESYARTHTLAFLRTAYLLTGSRQEAEDLTQETLLRIHQSWKRVRSAQHPAAYGRKILVNLYLTEKRRRHIKTVEFTETAQHVEDESPSGARFPDAIADSDYVRQGLARLPSRQRTALVLRYYLQLSDLEIATAMSIQPSTVRSSIARALEALHTQLINSGDHR